MYMSRFTYVITFSAAINISSVYLFHMLKMILMRKRIETQRQRELDEYFSCTIPQLDCTCTCDGQYRGGQA